MTVSSGSPRAIISYGPLNSNQWKLEPVKVRSLEPDELLIRMVGSGICHSDISIGSVPAEVPGSNYPKVLGHEGSGYVEAIGSRVTAASPGDPVLLSFSHCGICALCSRGAVSHCLEFHNLNVASDRGPMFQSQNASVPDIEGKFFGQSSFANLSIVDEASVVNVKGLVKSREELLLLSPLGCGMQTGMGTVLISAQATEHDTVAVMGLGGVGLSAVLGAKLASCRTIIAIDRVQSRLDVAKSLGATHTIDTTTLSSSSDSSDSPDLPSPLVQAVQKITGGLGTSITVDTTGAPALIQDGLVFTRKRGQYLQVGLQDFTYNIKLPPLFEFLSSGKIIKAIVEGDAVPKEFLPKMIQWWREGKLPIEKIVEVFEPDEFQEAVKRMHDGSTIKPVIKWS